MDPARWSWSVAHSYPFRTREHINILELRAILHTLEWRARTSTFHSCRFLHLSDSQVCLAVLVKGRSSSRKVNRLLRRICSLPGGVGNQKFLVAAKNQKKKSENQFFGFASWRPAFLHFSLHTSYIAQFVYRNCTRNVHYKKDMIIHVFFVYICVA